MNLQRREYKYIIDEPIAAVLRRRIAGICESDTNASAGGGRYVCDTLYLDTFDRRCYRATVDNAPTRYKLRVRRYSGDGPAFLEVKRRVDDTIIKTRAVLGADWAQRIDDDDLLDTIPSKSRPALENFLSYYRASYAGPMLPSVLVRYEREPYSSTVDPYVRITLDRKLEYQPKTELSFAPEQRYWMPIDDPVAIRAFPSRSAIVLELKFNDPAPSWLRSVVSSLELPRLAFCKYTRAIDSMLLRPERRESPLTVLR
ncbi:MAG: polyphosphate polymerase domain-containing protein [Polyangiales bacterium]